MADLTKGRFLMPAVDIMPGAIGATLAAPAIGSEVGTSGTKAGTNEWILVGSTASAP